jgi:hypothetical protein
MTVKGLFDAYSYAQKKIGTQRASDIVIEYQTFKSKLDLFAVPPGHREACAKQLRKVAKDAEKEKVLAA